MYFTSRLRMAKVLLMHFLVWMKHVIRYVEEGIDVKLEAQLVVTLRFHNGVANSVAKLLLLNRQKIKI